jgi:hypothetical protein
VSMGVKKWINEVINCIIWLLIGLLDRTDSTLS